MTTQSGARIRVLGVVQGVGFRPFVYQLALDHSLKGWVRNTSAGVDIELQGSDGAIRAFIEGLQSQAPPLARIDCIDVEECPVEGHADFRIIPSAPIPGGFQPISPDVSLCDDCRKELFDPGDFRFRYPFINCTNCGPRFTIITDVPYDRPMTTMAPFEMCARCSAEYHDPLNRRFHAQPVACPACGPGIWLEVDGERIAGGEDAIQHSRSLLSAGKVLAIKGLGGFHLACDGTNDAAVKNLRTRKLRVDKAFALMTPDMESVEAHCVLGEAEARLLTSVERPIVILDRKAESTVSREVAPNQETLGVMLPYTPLHELLIERAPSFPDALVMTSGNVSEEPIATRNDEALERLGSIADGFLMHDRGIQTRCDDSVVRAFEGDIYHLRRSRGYAPYPVPLAGDSSPLLATGGEMKNTFCLTKGKYAFMSHHIGELENFETLSAFEEGIAHYEKLFRIEPGSIAYDLHPDYLATRYALHRSQAEGIPAIGVQHHHAHIAACMAENGMDESQRVIGLAFDGTGYGDDGTIWGGEVLLSDYRNYERAFYLATAPMPGGDLAVRQPWRLALGWLKAAGMAWEDDLPPVRGSTAEVRSVIAKQIEQGINAPQTSSLGRLFDAVSAMIGCRMDVNYEAQAAIELESIIDREEPGAYEFGVQDNKIDPLPVVRSVVADFRAGVSNDVISARFHNGVADMTEQVCLKARERYDVDTVALSGGVWQNMYLLAATVGRLRKLNFRVLIHRVVPANDGGLALGQAVIALHRLRG
jgi:hydrogenase maturation protein HypF